MSSISTLPTPGTNSVAPSEEPISGPPAQISSQLGSTASVAEGSAAEDATFLKSYAEDNSSFAAQSTDAASSSAGKATTTGGPESEDFKEKLASNPKLAKAYAKADGPGKEALRQQYQLSQDIEHTKSQLEQSGLGQGDRDLATKYLEQAKEHGKAGNTELGQEVLGYTKDLLSGTNRTQSSQANERIAGNASTGSASGHVEFPHNGKHRPAVNTGGLDPASASKLVATKMKQSGEKNPTALYHTGDAKTVIGYEDEARRNGLKTYSPDPKAPDSARTVIHKFDHPIGADFGEVTSTMRLDGDHGHPIIENDPNVRTSFHRYVKDSVDKAKSDVKAGENAQSAFDDLDKKLNDKYGANYTPDKLTKGERNELAAAEKQRNQTAPRAEAANRWLGEARTYLNNKNEPLQSYGL